MLLAQCLAIILIAVALLGLPYTTHMASQASVPDCSDGTWTFTEEKVNLLEGVPWSLGRIYIKPAPPKVLGCLTIAFLWDFEYPVYQTWGTLQEHVQSLRKDQVWVAPVRGSKMEHVLRVDENKVSSAVLMIYDGDAERPAAWATYRNPLAEPVSSESVSAPVWH